MEIGKLFITMLFFVVIDAIVINNDNISNDNEVIKPVIAVNDSTDDVFNGVYTECFLHLSFLCLQNKTLLYLKELNSLSEVSVFGDYVKFVKLNSSKFEDHDEEYSPGKSSDELAYMIDKAIDHFFDNHVIKFTGLGREISMSNKVEEFVGRKKHQGGGGGGHGDDDGGKKKMMMMAMMCMKMKLMMMVPAMMGMMGMMSFKGMIFSMMSFMMSKIMLLMKILEKKGGAGIGGIGLGGDGGWAASAGGGGAWMPAGGPDYAGGGYDANGQWQSRSILKKENVINKPIISYVDPVVSISHNKYANLDEIIPFYNNKIMNKMSKDDNKSKLRTKRHLDEIETFNNSLKTNGNNIFASLTQGNYINEQKMITGMGLDTTLVKEEFSTTGYHKTTRADSLLDTDIRNLRIKRDLNANTELNKRLNNDVAKSRIKRSLIDAIQNSYLYWVNKILGLSNLNRRTSNAPKYKIVNGIKYIYHPFRKPRTPKDNKVKIVDDDVKIITAEDFNKGEIMEGGVESRMFTKKFHEMKDTVNDTIDENPWE